MSGVLPISAGARGECEITLSLLPQPASTLSEGFIITRAGCQEMFPDVLILTRSSWEIQQQGIAGWLSALDRVGIRSAQARHCP